MVKRVSIKWLTDDKWKGCTQTVPRDKILPKDGPLSKGATVQIRWSRGPATYPVEVMEDWASSRKRKTQPDVCATPAKKSILESDSDSEDEIPLQRFKDVGTENDEYQQFLLEQHHQDEAWQAMREEKKQTDESERRPSPATHQPSQATPQRVMTSTPLVPSPMMQIRDLLKSVLEVCHQTNKAVEAAAAERREQAAVIDSRLSSLEVAVAKLNHQRQEITVACSDDEEEAALDAILTTINMDQLQETREFCSAASPIFQATPTQILAQPSPPQTLPVSSTCMQDPIHPRPSQTLDRAESSVTNDLTVLFINMARSNTPEETIKNLKEVAEKYSEPRQIALKAMDLLFTPAEMASSNINGNHNKKQLDPIKMSWVKDLALATVPESNTKQTWSTLADRINSKCRGKLKSQKKTTAGAQDSLFVVTE